MAYKKSFLGLNTVLAYLSGALGLFLLFRLLRRKTTNLTNSNILPPVTFSPTPVKDKLTYDELFAWFRKYEGVKYRAYRDGKDSQGIQLFSIGMGHQIQPNELNLLNTTITEEKVRELFKKDIEEVVRDVDKVVTLPLNRNQKLAMVSIRYNVGAGGFRSKNLLSTLNAGDIAGTALIIPNFITTSAGLPSIPLQNRRREERNLFIKPV